MAWNWQQPDWPRFAWDPSRLAAAEARFLVSGGVLIGVAAHLSEPDRAALLVQLLGTDATDTSEIEGEILNRASVQSSIQRRLGLSAPETVHAPSPAEHGIAEMMVDLYQNATAPLTHQTMQGWNAMLMAGRRDLRDVGRYRTDPRPMQIVSGRIDRPTVHFEAVPTERVPSEMDSFLEWFSRTAPNGPNALPALTRAGIAHLYFESVHPFEDGNGRIGRAVSEKALAQGLGRQELTAIASTILIRKKAYYEALAAGSRTNHLDEWLRWFAGMALEAQQRTLARARFVLESARMLAGSAERLNPRQEKAVQRLLRTGPEGFVGGFSAANYRAITGAPTATTTRDLADLVAAGILQRRGERKGARYELSISVDPIPTITLTPDGRINEVIP